MTFEVRSLYPSEGFEAIITALLAVIALKSFEYVMKALLVSAGPERVSTSQYALAVTADQAWNPLNYISWLRGHLDFKLNTSTAMDSKVRRKVPLQRATIAVFIALLALISEAAFFWGTQTKRVDLTDNLLQIAVIQTNTNHGTKMRRNTCEPILLKEGRARLSAIFATCNVQEGQRALVVPGTVLRAKIFRTQFSIGVSIEDRHKKKMTSVTSFTLLLAKEENLFVRLKGNIQEAPSTMIHQYYRALGCEVSGKQVDDLSLKSCGGPVDPFGVLEIIVQHIGVSQDGRAGADVGKPVGEILAKSTGDVKVGFIMRQNYTATAILAITAALLTLAVCCHAFVTDDTSKVIACMLRERTGQDASIPAVAMTEGEVRIVRSFSHDKQEWYIGTVIPEGYVERSGASSP